MDTDRLESGSRQGVIQWAEPITLMGSKRYRIVYRLAQNDLVPSKETTLRPEQVYRNPRMGDPVRIQFCLSRVLRIDKAC